MNQAGNERRLMRLCFVRIKSKQEMIKKSSIILIIYTILESLIMILPLRIKDAGGLPLKQIKIMAIFSMVTKLCLIFLPLICLRYFHLI
jgi:hypothetical protein